MTTLASWLSQSLEELESLGVDEADLKLRWLAGDRLGLSHLLTGSEGNRVLTPGEQARLDADRRRLAAHEPLAYVLGHMDFRGLRLEVDPRVLIPRPETEELADLVLAVMAGHDDDACRVLDLCTGSGCIGLALAVERPAWQITLADLSADALALAARNADRAGCRDRISLIRSDLFDGLFDDTFDVIVSNPPYIRSGDIPGLQPEIRLHEPRLALDGGRDGWTVIDRIVAGAPLWLANPGGFLVMEIGEDQGAEAEKRARHAGFRQTDVRRDLQGRDRMLICET